MSETSPRARNARSTETSATVPVDGIYDTREALLAPPTQNGDLAGSPCQHGSRGAHRLDAEEKENMLLIEDYYPTGTYLALTAGHHETLEEVQVPVGQAICGPLDLQAICGEGQEQASSSGQAGAEQEPHQQRHCLERDAQGE